MNRPVGTVKAIMSTPRSEGSVRDRLLAAANELFYEEGVHTVGIERVLERAGVAKASLYSTFGSKDELVRAYLESRAASRRARITERIARHADPRDRIVAIFELLAETVESPTFRGCAFVNASAEGPRNDAKVVPVCTDHRGWLRATFRQLTDDLGAADPDHLASQLVLLYDGALVGASMDRDPSAVARARELVESLLGAAAPRRQGRRRA
jgi:AcrR family transcriptional regulator